MPDLLLTADRIVTPARTFAPGWLHVVGDLVEAVGPGLPPRPADLDLGDVTVTPGFVDTHLHGGGGAAFDGGDADAVARAVAAHRAHGTTTMLASLVSDTVEELVATGHRMRDLVAHGVVGGLHLEGPWLSPNHQGAHDPTKLALPDERSVALVVNELGDLVRMVTIAPELPGAIDAIRTLSSLGFTVAIGHTDATYDQARAALDAGATVGTHLFNAMRGLHHREPGPIAALLEHPDAHVELICDGVHVHPAMVGLVAAAKPQHTVLVTDAMAAAAAPDGDYRLGSLDVQVRDRQARLLDGTIAGSTATLADSVALAVRRSGLSLEDAVRAATATPAALHGLEWVGSLRPGKHADLVVLDADLAVTRVMRQGTWQATGGPVGD